MTMSLAPRDRLTPKRIVRLVNAQTGEFLHLSAQHDVPTTQYAWSGTPTQARNLRTQAVAAGREFPYRARVIHTPIAASY